MSETKVDTKVTTEEMDINDILGMPGADDILTAEELKPNVFSRTQDLKFLDEKDPKKPEKKEETKHTEQTPSQVVNEVADPNPKSDTKDRNPVADIINAMVKSKKLVPFEDEKPVEQYTTKDLEELIDANLTERENKVREKVPIEFFDSLPEELQVAAKYVADGGKDLKGLFKALSHAEEVRDLDPADPDDHESIVRQYLTLTRYGTPEEIAEEITGLKDRNELEKKAGQFKPKLDKMGEAIVAQKLAQQEDYSQRQQSAAKTYMGNVYKVLEPGEINGLKLDKKTQNLLYSGLVRPDYPSISGRNTNLLGHLLEKYQYVEPRHDLIAEALWLLSDPDSYKNKLREQGKNGQIEKTVRQLKTEEANRTSGSPIVEKDEVSQRRIPRNNNFFKH